MNSLGFGGGASLPSLTDTGSLVTSTSPIVSSFAASNSNLSIQHSTGGGYGIWLAPTITAFQCGGSTAGWVCVANTQPAGVQTGSGSAYGFSSSTTNGAAGSDTFLRRGGAAGVLRAEAASSASGAMLASQLVSTKTGNYTVVVLDSGTVFTNNGAAGAVAFTLPASPTVGLTYTFVVMTAQNVVITANTGQTIRNGGSTSTSGGTATNNVVGSTITIIAMTATQWFVVNTPIGTWTLA